MAESDEELFARVNKIAGLYGCEATDLGPDSVGVQGDARVYGPSVFVTFDPALSPDEVKEISTEITNKVSGITRVLMNIVPTY